MAQNCAVVLLGDFNHRPGDHWAGKTGSEQVVSVLAEMSTSGQAEHLTSVLIDRVACGQVSANL